MAQLNASISRDARLHVVNSALWAAAGDALGWITELVGPEGVQRRTGEDEIDTPVSWTRRIGGKFGVQAALPAGTYSDDTQLRLATSRAIRGNGVFDPEAFAKIELPVWQSYSLGAGRGSLTAAASLSRQDRNWFSNFYDVKGVRYVDGGGNGAAMRIQPHVWASPDNRPIDSLILDILRNAVVTHGSLHGIVGAVFHGLCLWHTFRRKAVPDVETWSNILETISVLPETISADRQLAAFWLPAWEDSTERPFSAALRDHLAELHRDIGLLGRTSIVGNTGEYRRALESIGCFRPDLRGSGSKTALAAAYAALMHAELGVERALVLVANTLNSDTDTIGTMCGAILGTVADRSPSWPIQDRSYIVAEAERMAEISEGAKADSFRYPDLARWEPPQNQLEAVRLNSVGGRALIGIGDLREVSERYPAKDHFWCWMELHFGQTILVKQRFEPKTASSELLAGERVLHRPVASAASTNDRSKNAAQIDQPMLFKEDTTPATRESSARPREVNSESSYVTHRDRMLDDLTDQVIQSDFDPLTVGEAFNHLVDEFGSTSVATGFAAVIAKAKIARKARRR